MNDTLTKYNKAQLATTETVGHEMAMVQADETISSVLAAQAKAEVEARLIVAMKNPRNYEVVRDRMKKEVERPGFADVAWYDLDRQSKGSGFSVKFAEAALRNMRNMDPRSTIIYDDDEKMIVKIEVVDLESNISISNMHIISKTVERKKLKQGEVAISQRVNSYGQVTYTRRATSDEMLPKLNSTVSKSFRNAVLRLLPGDIQDECKRRILEIRQRHDAKDPDAVKRQVCDAFSEIGIGPDKLEQYLGHYIDSSSPAEMEDLRTMFRNIKAGEVNFHDELEQRESERQEKKNKKSKLEQVADRVKGEKNAEEK